MNQRSENLFELAQRVKARARQAAGSGRYLLGIAGPPASGKSTLSKKLAEAIAAGAEGMPCVSLSMDGFHKTNAELTRQGLLSIKGAPHTFDADGFVSLLSTLRSQSAASVSAPEYDRALHDPQPDAIVVEPAHRLVIVEGNYLLLEEKPWDRCRALFDEIWYLDVPLETVRSRLMKRHRHGGRTLEEAYLKVESSDIPNARRIDQSKPRAHELIGEIDALDLEEAAVPVEIVGLGVATLDILSLVEAFPVGREVMRSEASVVQGGGPVATALAAASQLGAQVAHIDVRGDDWVGALIDKSFLTHGMRRTYLRVEKNRSSSLANILVRKSDAARAIVFHPGSVAELSAAEVRKEWLAGAKVFHCNGRHLGAALQMADWARELGVTVSFDGGAGRFRPELVELMKRCDLSIVARDFARQLTGGASVEEAAVHLHGLGASLAVITCGSEGSYVHEKGTEPFWQKAFPVPEPVDTTGCGDSYHGAFLFGHITGLGLKETARLASAVAAFNCRALGGRGHLPTLAEVRAFMGK